MATYKGTKITGTSTTAKTFPKSGISNAKANQTYLNTSTGHVYTCAKAGKASEATWRYTRTDIVAKPSISVKSLGAPTRASGTRKMTASWKVPDALVNAKKGDRATGLEIQWILNLPTKWANDPKRIYANTDEKATSSTVNLSSLAIGSKTYTRASFYPLAGMPKLYGVYVRVRGVNGDKFKNKGKWSDLAYRAFAVPRKAAIAAYEFDSASGRISTTVTAADDVDYQERYDTLVKWFVGIQRNGAAMETLVNQTASFTGVSSPRSYDMSQYQSLDDGEYYVAECRATSRGYAGDSAETLARIVVGPPAIPIITGVEVTGATSSSMLRAQISIETAKSSGGYVVNQVDGVSLQYLADVPYADESAIPGSETWNDAGSVDNGNVTCLTASVPNLIPTPGKHTWIRVKAWRLDDKIAALTRYSSAWRVDALATPAPTASDDQCAIVSLEPGADGSSAVVVIGYDAVGAASPDDADGTELSWSDDPGTWKSTTAPSTHDVEWSDDSSADPDNWNKTQTVTIRGLETGEAVYVRARRYMEGEKKTEYGPYCNIASTIPTVAPTTVELGAPRTIAAGADVPLTWTYDGGAVQRSWIVRSGGTVIAEGTDSRGSCTIPAERFAAFAVDGIVSLSVAVSTGGNPVESETAEIVIAQSPGLAVELGCMEGDPASFAAGIISRQPAAVRATCTAPGAFLSITVRSQGGPTETPAGPAYQTAGDAVWSDVVAPEWEESGGSHAAIVELPPGRDFIDKLRYTVEAVAIDPVTGLRSATATAEAAVSWEHQAPVPDACCTLTPVDETDDEGRRTLGVLIELTPPAGSASTDVFDVYRLPVDGPQLVGEGFPLTHSETDGYAPFGEGMEHYYRIACRTADGDVEWADYDYELDGDFIRLDFGDESLELPGNISIGDKWGKDFEARTHLDGTTEGYWNEGAERKSSLSTTVVRLESAGDVRAARALARYAGPVFVRTPDGAAYAANVEVGGADTEGPVVDLSLDATEVAMPAAFMLPDPYSTDNDDLDQG